MSEQEFMEKLMNHTGPVGMANYGGMWRNRWRTNPQKCFRVLVSMEADLKEGKEVRSRGGYLADLWKRLP
jgi:hypothetical protein